MTCYISAAFLIGVPVYMHSLPPQKFREILFQLLYSKDFGSDPAVNAMVMVQLRVTKKAIRSAEECVEKILIHISTLDSLIEDYAKEYEFLRIPKVELNILRLSFYELLFAKEQPPKVVIAEAMRLARKFATKEAALFVNAVVDSAYQASLKEEANLVTAGDLKETQEGSSS